MLRGLKDAESAVPLSTGKAPENPQGRWNYLDVTVTGNTAAVTLNGKALDNVALKTAEGGIGLSPSLEYRNIRIKRVTAK